VPEHTLSPGQWGIVSFLVSEVALFGNADRYLRLLPGQGTWSARRLEVLSLSLVLCTTTCLLLSSGTVHIAEKALHRGNQGGFLLWWFATIVPGSAGSWVATAYEWYGLIVDKGLTISRNLFGTTFYTLVGLHAIHVTGGVTIMLIVFGPGSAPAR